MIDFYLMYQWSFIFACFGVAWVHFITNVDGLLWKLPRLYPKGFFKKMLECEKCIAGWGSIVFLLLTGNPLEALPACFISMIFARVIAKTIA